jgi:hypothetical protein
VVAIFIKDTTGASRNMNNHPFYQKTCLAALLLAACCSAVAEPDAMSPAAQDPAESRATAPAVPAAREVVVATARLPAASAAESAGNPVAASGGEAPAPATAESDDGTPIGEAEIDAGGDADAVTGPEAAAAPVAAIDPATLYGEWTVKEEHPEAGEVVTLFSINNDSSFAGTMTVAGNVVWSYSGNWYLDGNLITWFYTQSTPPLMLVDETEVDEIIAVDSEKLTYRSGTRDVLETLYRSR